jgi:hypothetical protein
VTTDESPYDRMHPDDAAAFLAARASSIAKLGADAEPSDLFMEMAVTIHAKDTEARRAANDGEVVRAASAIEHLANAMPAKPAIAALAFAVRRGHGIEDAVAGVRAARFSGSQRVLAHLALRFADHAYDPATDGPRDPASFDQLLTSVSSTEYGSAVVAALSEWYDLP